ncbi:MAG: hypothetical protein KatS3mg050_1826 [Litorilinea sp.]|nr:MAG: hypothetical protein KatS3mg050_1826 [Litorilinea sp.]
MPHAPHSDRPEGRATSTASRKANWRAIWVLCLVAGLFVLAGHQVVRSQTGQPDDLPNFSNTVRITKFASPAAEAGFNFSCEGCPNQADSSFTLTDTVPGQISVEQYRDISATNPITITELTPPGGYQLYKIECLAQAGDDPLPLDPWAYQVVGSSVVVTASITELGKAYCNFYNAIPTDITIVKVATPSVGSDYVFSGTLGQFTLDDADPDDGDSITNTQVFSNLLPGSYDIYEILPPGSNALESLVCSVHDKAVEFGPAVVAQADPTTAGYVTDLSNDGTPDTACDGCAPYVSNSPNAENQGVLEFMLPDPVAPTDGAILKLHLGMRNIVSPPLSVSLYGYVGNGTVENGDFDAGSLIATFTISNEAAVAIDVTDFISTQLANNVGTVGFGLRLPGEDPSDFFLDDLNPSLGQTPGVLHLTTSTGRRIELEGGRPVVCTFGNREGNGRITVDKVTFPAGSPAEFSFSLNGGPNQIQTGFVISDTAPPFDSGPLAPGTYSLTMETLAGWNVTAVLCTDGVNEYDPSAISLPAGVTVACTFTCTQQSTIVVDKLTMPAGDTTPFSMTLDGQALSSPIQFQLSDGSTPFTTDLDPGLYSLTEAAVPGWALTAAACSDSSPLDAIDLEPGETVTCTLTNSQMSVAVTKTVGLDATSCGASSQLTVAPGTPVYFCVTLENTGHVTLSDHVLVDQAVGLNVTFPYTLPPGAQVQITNDMLTSLDLPPLLGPITATSDISNTVVITSSQGTSNPITRQAQATVTIPPTALEGDDQPARPEEAGENRIYLPLIGADMP